MRIVLFMALLAGTLCAQYPAGACALRWDGATSSAGPFCWGFSCVPEIATVVAGESGTLMLRGEYNQVYAIGMSFGASRCISVPNIYNSLVLDDPIFLVGTGICDMPSPILACPSGQKTISLAIPAAVPSGLTVSMQGVVAVPSGPALPAFTFTQTITFVVL